MAIPSTRVPADFTPNRLTALLEEKRQRGRRILDLTVTNPSRVGLATPEEDLYRALAVPGLSNYDPDPRGAIEARASVARYYDGQWVGPGPFDPDLVFLTSSTSEGYAHALRLLCEPGDEILLPSPSYPLLEPLARLTHVQLSEYRLVYDTRWRVDLDSLEARIGPRTRGVIVVQPNNPTGSCLTRSEADAIEAICVERGLALISDEVFGEFPWPPRTEPFPSFAAGSRRAPTFILNGISKLCGLPQMKLGWIVLTGPHERVAPLALGLAWINDLFLSVGAPAQLALPSLLEGRSGFQARALARMETNLRLLRAWSAAESNGSRLLHADGGWSAILRAGPDHAVETREIAERLLEKHDVLVHPGFFYDLPDTDIVVSLLTEPATVTDALSRMTASSG